MDRRKVRREEAEARTAARAAASPKKRLTGLDERFGKDQGAKKERAKLRIKKAEAT